MFCYPSQGLQEHSQILLRFKLEAVRVVFEVDLFFVNPLSLDFAPNLPNPYYRANIQFF